MASGYRACGQLRATARDYRVVLAVLLAALAFPPRAFSQGIRAEKPHYRVDFWSEADGLPQSRIRAIAQTRDGYLWFGTDSGLVRFDGATFLAYTVQTGSLRDNEVWSLAEDDDGALWIGTMGG